MSAHQIFQRAFAHAQLTRPPDDYPSHIRHARFVQLAQREALPMDGQALLTILNWYGLEDEVGFFICRNYPQLAAKINPTLAAGLGPFDPRLSHEDKFRKNYVINLAQTALDGKKYNPAPATPKAENRTASTVKLRAEIRGGNIIWRAEPDTQSDQETRSESKPASEKPLEKSNSEPAFPTKVTNDREAKDEEEADIDYHTQDSITSPSGLSLRT